MRPILLDNTVPPEQGRAGASKSSPPMERPFSWGVCIYIYIYIYTYIYIYNKERERERY